MSALPPIARTEVLDMYPKAKRLALSLYNEYEHPTTSGVLPMEEYNEVRAIYERFVELTGLRILNPETGAAFTMTLPWEVEGGSSS